MSGAYGELVGSVGSSRVKEDAMANKDNRSGIQRYEDQRAELQAQDHKEGRTHEARFEKAIRDDPFGVAKWMAKVNERLARGRRRIDQFRSGKD